MNFVKENRAADWEPAASIKLKIGNHAFRATGIAAYLKNGGTREKIGSAGEPCRDALAAAP
jgi:hypothetical protein